MTKTRYLLLLLCACAPLCAQRRFDVTPLIGYRFHDSFPTKDADDNRGEGKFAHGEDFGVAAGFRFWDDQVIEFRWMRQNTSLQLTGPLDLGTRRQGAAIDQFQGDFTKEYIMDEFPKMRPYVIGSVGAAKVKSAGANFTRFSFGLGGGVKLFPTSRVGFRFDAQWVPLYIEPELKNVICGGGCIIAIGGKLVHQIQFSVGPIFSF